MHIGLTGTNHFYQDPDKTAAGDDDDVSNGIDTTLAADIIINANI